MCVLFLDVLNILKDYNNIDTRIFTLKRNREEINY